MTITVQDLPAILASHQKWVRGEKGGSRADLSGVNLSGANLSWANLTRANLSRTNLSRANLSGANLYGADLSRANLSGANLYGADLSGANLSRTNLSRANLSGDNGLLPLRVQPLLMLYDQPGKIRAYKLVSATGDSPMQSCEKLHYEIGETVSVKHANTDVTNLCAAGVNVATLDWCATEWCEGWRILVVEFTAKDIACIPTASDGKFRLHRCKVVGEKDLVEIGLKAAPGGES